MSLDQLNTDATTKSINRLNLIINIITYAIPAVSIGLYIYSFVLPVAYDNDHSQITGIWAFLLSIPMLLDGDFAWFANIFFITAWAFFLAKFYKSSIILSVIAYFLSLQFIINIDHINNALTDLQPQVDMQLRSIGYGYYIWQSAFIALFIFGVIVCVLKAIIHDQNQEELT